MIFTHKTQLSCAEIEKRIEDESKAFGLIMKKHYPFSQNLPEAGFEIKEHASVFELCKPSIASKLLNTHPELSSLMPCRISVYNKNGEAYVSTPNIDATLKSLVCEDALKAEVLALYTDMKEMLKGW